MKQHRHPALAMNAAYHAGDVAHYVLHDAATVLRMDHGAILRVDGASAILHCALGEGEVRLGDRLEYAGTLAAFAIETGDIVEMSGERMRCGLKSSVAMPFKGGNSQWVLTLASTAVRDGGLAPDEFGYLRLLAPVLTDLVEHVYVDPDQKRYALYDMTTELPNRAMTVARLAEALAQAERSKQRVAFLYVDLDGFKGVNDAFGHAFGDAVLAEIAHRMRDTMRRDELVGRLGGDEFGVVVPVVRHDGDLIEIAERIVEAVSKPIVREHMMTEVHASLGIAVYPDDGRSVEELIAHADVAMYRAKRQSGSQYFWYNRELEEDVRLCHELSSNLLSERIDREFLLCFQPIVGARSARLAGVEALLRWLHPSMGLLSPKRFLGVAQTHQLISMIDSWVVRAAFEQARKWRSGGLNVPIYVNISAIGRDVIEMLRDTVNSGNLDPALLKLEISEELAAADFDATAAFVTACRDGGLHVGLDRFGSGGLPLTKLVRLKLDFVKLDRDVVSSLHATPQGLAAAEALIAMAKRFGWNVVAEGVENDAQREWLQSKEVDALQGYAIAHPMTAVDLSAWAGAPARM
ncbi:MAG: putative bifunctional diguanylate cyclase/phosphodiesterase [Vulcanimicrobiaceae bacterium]